MDNPFKKRATEFFEDAGSFLSLISPEPLRLFFEEDTDSHFDRLVVVVGTPGRGKTTVARLMELDILAELIRSKDSFRDIRAVAAVLNERGVLKDDRPRFVAYRLAAGSSLREVWELPYTEPIRHALLRSLIQAKCVLGWMRKIERAGVDLRKVRLVPREGTEAQQKLLGTDDLIVFRDRARQFEEELFKVITALVPPPEDSLTSLAIANRYDAFSTLQAVVIPGLQGLPDGEITLKPMLILDDAHELHPAQFDDVENWLRSRELTLARWLVTRVDAMGPDEFRKALAAQENQTGRSGTTLGRDRIVKLMQREGDRRTFRDVARDVSKRYFSQMPLFSRRGIENLDRCLRQEAPVLSVSNLRELSQAVAAIEKQSKFSNAKLASIKTAIPSTLNQDQQLAVYRILLTRERNKAPQNDMFGVDPELEPETYDSKGRVKSSVIVGAELQLAHQYDRPFYFGFERLADCSSSNIEQFIALAGVLVDEIDTKLVKGREPMLDAREQHRALSTSAKQTIDAWDFPRSDLAKRLVVFIAGRCLARTLEDNAPLDDGANAFGVPQAEMDRLKELAPELIGVLHYALAYNALSLRENYDCKNKLWCLFELGGLPLIAHKLPLSKGGFCEGRLQDLVDAIDV